MRKKLFTCAVLALALAMPATIMAQEVTFWNFSDTGSFPSATYTETTTISGLTFVTDGSSEAREPVFEPCPDRIWTGDNETLTFTQRMKFNGASSSAYRWMYFTAQPGDTIEVWGNSTSSSSARTLTLRSGGYNGLSLGTVSLATGSTPSYGYVTVESSEPTVVAVVSSGSWYTYAIRVTPNPSYTGPEKPLTRQWYLKHPWGGGSWEWREVFPNADATLYSRRDVFGGNGCNYADNAQGSNSSWLSLSNVTLKGSPEVGDSAEFIFDPNAGSITIRNLNDVPEDTTQHWFFKHGWGDGLSASWEWRELSPNADKTIYSRDDVYGGTGCNYADNKYGSNSVWVPLADIKLVNNPVTGDSARFEFDPATKAITITLLKAGQQGDDTPVPDPDKLFSLVGGRVFLDNSVAGWDDDNIYLVVGDETASQCVRFLPDAEGRLTCPMPYTKENITYMAVIGNSSFSSGAFGPAAINSANHYSAVYTGGLQSGVNDGWTITLTAAGNGSPITITHLDGEYGETFTTEQKNNCYRLNDELKQITFIFSTARTRFVVSPLNVQKLYVYGSISNWSQDSPDYQMPGYSADGCFYLTLPYANISYAGNGGQPEFLFKVYHVNGNSYVTQSWPTLEEGCAEHLTFCSNGWKQIVAFNDDDIDDLLQRKETALYIRPLADFDLTTREDQEKISNFRLVPGTQHLFRSYHPYHSSRSSYDTEHARLEWVAKLAAEAGINCDIALSGNLESEDGTKTYTVGDVTYTTTIPDYYREIIANRRVLYVGTQNGHTPSYDYALFFSDSERFAQWIQEIVRFINDDEHPVPFQIHCHLGADRTGAFSGTLAAMCGASWDDIAADYMRTSDLQVSEYRHSNQLRYAFYKITGFDPLILPSGADAQPTVFTENTLAEAQAAHSAYGLGTALYTYPEVGTKLPTLAQAVKAHFVKGGYLGNDEIEACAAKLRGDDPSAGVQDIVIPGDNSPRPYKIVRGGQVLIVRGDKTYDITGRIVSE